ncbi:hypothetical protein [Flavihumibacter sp. CACIAM 22H1]|uniref:hypothetical protein n=1 Tax=Flavihumibacter sp. CACIAM 22H1 TaxID=1812911 RepID=UPI0025BDC4E1|nr:hypothetical protein [Flavihumibacter sp. CACIAM 22H1]
MKKTEQGPSFNEDPHKQLRIENELMRIRLQVEHGAQVYIATDLSPEMENLFLKMVLSVEGKSGAGSTVVHQYIGRPKLPDLSLARSEKQVVQEAERLLAILDENSIDVVFREDLSWTEMLRFLVEDLMPAEIDNCRAPELRSMFFYDSYYPPASCN